MVPFRLPPGDLRIVCLGAHPDDIEVGCGGTLLALAGSRRVEATAVVATGSGARHSEAVKATPRFLPDGDVDVEVLELVDGRLPAQWDAVKQRLEDIARPITTAAASEGANTSPDIVFAPRRDDAHQDHRLIGELASTVWRDSLIMHYEIPKWDGDLGGVTHYVPLDMAVAHHKVELLHECFPSQAHHDWWDDETFLALMRLRGVECRQRYAEGFLVGKAVLLPGTV